MISLEMTQEGYDGIPANAEALTADELEQLAVSKDVTLIPHLISMIKGLQGEVATLNEALTEASAGS